MYDSEVSSSLLISCGVGVSLVASSSAPLDIPDSVCGGAITAALDMFSVICDTAVDAIPVTQRSHSSPWSSLVLMTSRKLRESSLIIINHTGRSQLSMNSFDLINHQESLGFFRIGNDHVLQIVPSELVLLELKTLRKPVNISKFDCSTLQIPRGQVIEKCTQGGFDSTGRDGQLGRACPYFAISSRQDVKIFVFENSSAGPVIREIVSKQLESEVSAIALTPLCSSSGSEFLVAVSTWDSGAVTVIHVRGRSVSGSLPVGRVASYTVVSEFTAFAATPEPECVGEVRERANIRLLHCFSFPSEQPGVALIYIACGSLDGSMTVLRLQHDQKLGQVNNCNDVYREQLCGGIIKFVSHPQDRYQRGSGVSARFIVNGGEGDFLYSYSGAEGWTRVSLCRPSRLCKRACLTSVHSHVGPFCSFRPAVHLASGVDTPPPSDTCAEVRGLTFAWMETTSCAQTDDLMLCVGSPSPSDVVLSTHIQARVGFDFKVVEMVLVAKSRLLLLLWARNGSCHGEFSGSSITRQSCGVTLLDAESLETLWDYDGDASVCLPVGVCECPIPSMGCASQNAFLFSFGLVMTNDTVVCFGGRRVSDNTHVPKLHIDELVRFRSLSGLGMFSMLGAGHMVCADAVSIAVYGWEANDLQDHVGMSITEQSVVVNGTVKVAAILFIFV
jgi:hypothetical protein